MSFDPFGLSNFLDTSVELSDQQKLEKEFCTGFSCCGLRFDNLHELLEHDERYHVSQSDDEVPITEQEAFRHPIPVSCTFHINNGIMTPSPDPSQLATKPKTYITLNTVAGNPPPTFQPSIQAFLGYDQVTVDTVSTPVPPRPALAEKTAEEVIDDDDDKPYRCSIKDCDKAYKNANGLKYHLSHGHIDPNSDVDSKPFICNVTLEDCNKRYKNLNGLKYHIEHTHGMKLNLTSDMFITPNH